ncbi:MAG: Rne/Rng family ribonuclease, partial [Rhodospirillales bacterium]|nr:Rne/Rng family ribonuclease [Rhodospirillales bacterium]
MTKRMLIDATHAEETRVVVLDGNRLEDFDVETSTKKQLKGNIYLAKIVRVEPSLQAAFVEYGGGRHGFLAFSEIHPDYYQIPVADRERLLRLQAEEAREDEEREDEAVGAAPPRRPEPRAQPTEPDATVTAEAEVEAEGGSDAREQMLMERPGFTPDDELAQKLAGHAVETPQTPAIAVVEATPEPPPSQPAAEAPSAPPADTIAAATEWQPESDDDAPPRPAQAAAIEREERFGSAAEDEEAPLPPRAAAESDTGESEPSDLDAPQADMPPPETIGGENDGGDGAEEARARRAARFLRNYRIQEVIKRRQILLVQVVKEERGTKGAALTTYISLAGRFGVLMPNSPRGGGISRKITSAADRRRLKEITAELDIPSGMGLIIRTAGANRPKPEIKRDCEYLMRLWDDIREHTMKSVAPALIYEEASLIKRAIRDVYSRDIDEVVVDGEDGWRGAHDFMRMLMPSHARKVQLWRGNGQPLFAKYQVEAQLDAMLMPTVQLRSGGYLVINQTEALVAIDVNSGRSTRERGIEETALRTNLEAADEVARQLRLRDLAGLIVIDFIDMEARKHNAMVERRLKDALKIDRARIQVGHISHFGLLEMSRQRLRPSLAETSFSPCPHCGGTGHVRSTESSAIHVLRAIEEEGAKGRAAAIRVQVASAVALYLLNHKRERLAEIEARYALHVEFEPDDSLVPPQIRIERLRPQVPEAERLVTAPVAPAAPVLPAAEEEEAAVELEDEAEGEAEESAADETGAPGEARPAGDEAERRRRRRRRRRGGRRDTPAGEAA